MISRLDASSHPPTMPRCWGSAHCLSCPITYCHGARHTQEAIRLIQTGARGNLVHSSTGLSKKFIKKLFLLVNGQSSTQGRTAYTDAWFAESEQRMLHANIVWRLYTRTKRLTSLSPARQIVDLVEAYYYIVPWPMLDFTRIESVIRLMNDGIWRKRSCEVCGKHFVAPKEEVSMTTCPGCKLYFRHRCRDCGSALRANPVGRPHSSCDQCAEGR